MAKKLRIGIRPSPLASKQFEEVVGYLKDRYSGRIFEIKKIFTPGDRDKITPISQVEGSDFFTADIDQQLLEGEIDLAVHSSKDLPEKINSGLELVFESDPLSPFDALVSRQKLKFFDLPAGWRIGTSSQRRKEQVKALRPDLTLVDIRGNIEERLDLIRQGKIDALIVAEAALLRLGLEKQISQVLPQDIFPAHPKQGQISILARKSG